MTNSLWHNSLKKSMRELTTGDYPLWMDGFADVFLHGHTSDDNDNPYVPQEPRQHRDYREGALAAESLISSARKDFFYV